MGDIDPLFLRILKQVQQRFKEVIPETVKVDTEFSVHRLLRRGATAEKETSQKVSLKPTTGE